MDKFVLGYIIYSVTFITMMFIIAMVGRRRQNKNMRKIEPFQEGGVNNNGKQDN